MNHDANPKKEHSCRIRTLQKRLEKNGLDGALILQNADLFYFAGTIQQAWLFIPADGLPLLMARKDFLRARAESPVENVVPFHSPRRIPDLLTKNGYTVPGSLGLELDVMPVNQYMGIQKIFPGTKLTDISDDIRSIRAVKSGFEIEQIRIAADGSDKVARFVQKRLKEGMTELELAGMAEGYARSLGHQGIVRMRMWNNELFYGHLLSGPDAAEPSYLASPTGGKGVSAAVAQGAGYRKIKAHEPLLLDFVFVHNGYISDHTRIFSIGDIDGDLRAAHETCLSIEADIKSFARPGVSAGAVYERAVSLADDAGYADHFMGVGPTRIRFVGHGVGLELDEYPFLAKGQTLPLEENMVIALEPKMIFPGKGVVGIENTHRVTKEGLAPFGNCSGDIGVVAIA